ncbi:restriction endonuclease subunit S [Streptococcus thermophilus]|uniref:Type I restriction-modification system, specificity subunit S n=1 Tax=Streptococcus thermophilus TaxID=1308 RepID=A0AAU9H6X2_STRTR|nr:restriction endonuclease subunit S [Streptococcus thermophilus]MBZ5807565.1 restriction endonuclease subunit S [Streptococcus thermophilus]MBZ5838044.1 restriction endonuclease subunit S [Streptococcus thermophilus]MDG0264427.1 restriction endonuclease subunit S [Streptococcus thermophilus]CAD0155055.1 Type I restriction-modification system, specificity subunit S [Streptococcus thermophilus]
MMISQRKNIPLVRVKGFEGPWELCTLGEHIEDYVEKTTVQNQYPVLTSSQNKGIVRQEDYFANRQVTTDSNIGYFVLPKGFFTYRSRSDNGVFKFNRNDIVDKGIISYFYPVFSIIEGDSDFYLKLLNTSITKQAMLQAEGTGQKVLSLRKFKSIKASVPSLAEQSAIGSLFRTLDYLLASYKDNLANYQSLKVTMLSKMFPKVGQTVPVIRLDGFEGEWENKILSEVTNITMGQSPKSENYTDNPNDYILVQGNADIKDKQVVPRLWTTEVTKMAEIGDIILTVRAPVGDIGKTDYNVVIGRGVAAIKGNDFIFYTLEKMKMTGFWNKFSTGSTFESISSNDIKEAIIQIPTLEEQQAIGAYFSNLDNLINSYQEKISQLETLKKKLLQDMFI